MGVAEQSVEGRLAAIRAEMRDLCLADEHRVIRQLIDEAALSADLRAAISTDAAALVRKVREQSRPTMMEQFLAEFGLSTKEGVALMCLAEALLRVPDSETIDALIEDKITAGNWAAHRGHSDSPLINASTWALLITGKVISPVESKGVTDTLKSMIKRLGEPVVRAAVAQAMKELGRQFVLGRTIDEAMKRGREQAERGYTHSYDMLGEAARTDADARRYHKAYADAIRALTPHCTDPDIRNNPGISVKLSALHARYEYAQRERVMDELVPRTLELARLARAGNMGFNIDAEEADRLDLSLDVIEAVLSDPSLAGWDGFGVVVQAYGKRARLVLDWLYQLAVRLDRKIMVRLVKGAYWDAEIKRAQVLGLPGFPVFTRKACSDVSYIACAKKLLAMTDRIYPQFATHNAHSVAAVLKLAEGRDDFEFQRLHGMGESLHDTVVQKGRTRCRIYAPVGAHRDLLAYLVRRLLENGANSSFVNQIVDTRIAPETIAADPFAKVEALGEQVASEKILPPARIFDGQRRNSRGYDFTDPLEMARIDAARTPFQSHRWQGAPLIDGQAEGGEKVVVRNPANPADEVGTVTEASAADVERALDAASRAFADWSALPVSERAERIRRVGELYEAHFGELFALTCREAGKTLPDAIAELREAVDFAYYYAEEAIRHANEGRARGVICCISPWNFPLAIFSGQILAALAAGNVVVAKPAEATPLIACRAVELMHEAGIPRAAIQLLPGRGPVVGAALTGDPRVAGVCFTGSTATAQRINRTMAGALAPDAPLVAETGGLNAMIVDSTALPEQVVRDVVTSAFQSAGQRCSALRMLYVQKDVADRLLEMLFGAMDELRLGDPWQLASDIGPVIDAAAKAKIDAHRARWGARGRILKEVRIPRQGHFVAPTVIRVDGIEDLEEEIFGPVLHVATFEADELEQVVERINAKGYGLTFGLHTRVDSRVDAVCQRIRVGNIYVNRNQIGAIVGSQPFGGEGLSGTGPKAGGPHYLSRFLAAPVPAGDSPETSRKVGADEVQPLIDAIAERQWPVPATGRAAVLRPVFGEVAAALDGEPQIMPGPTGELNQLSCHPRGVILCLGPDAAALKAQVAAALSQGNRVVAIAENAGKILQPALNAGLPVAVVDGTLAPDALTQLGGFAAVTSNGDAERQRALRVALAARDGALLPLITQHNRPERFVLERHLCVDTTAAGGNASLIAASE